MIIYEFSREYNVHIPCLICTPWTLVTVSRIPLITNETTSLVVSSVTRVYRLGSLVDCRNCRQSLPLPACWYTTAHPTYRTTRLQAISHITIQKGCRQNGSGRHGNTRRVWYQTVGCGLWSGWGGGGSCWPEKFWRNTPGHSKLSADT